MTVRTLSRKKGAASSSNAKRLPSIGRYRLLAELGSGTTSNVYLARAAGYSEEGKFFAIKVLRPHLYARPALLEAFLEEHRLAARIKHRRVIGVHAVNIERGRAYAALQYVRGESLETVLRTAAVMGRRLSFEAIASLFASVAEGLEAAHAVDSLFHSALLAKNIILGFDGVPRLADCGVSKVDPAVGLDQRADIHSVGVMIRDAVHRTDSPPELEAILTASLSRDPAARQASAGDLARALRGFASARSSELDATDEVRTLMRDLFGEKFDAQLAMERRAMLEMRAMRGASPIPLEIVVGELETPELDRPVVRAYVDPAEAGETPGNETKLIRRLRHRPTIDPAMKRSLRPPRKLRASSSPSSRPMRAVSADTVPVTLVRLRRQRDRERHRVLFAIAMAVCGVAALALMAWAGL